MSNQFRRATALFSFFFLMVQTITALEIRVQPEKSPVNGLDMSAGIVLIRESGRTAALEANGSCRLEDKDEQEILTLDVFVPGYEPGSITCRRGSYVELFLPLQAFKGDTITLDLGETASRTLAARDMVNTTVEEARAAPPSGNPNAAPATGPPAMNPFVLIETIIGKSIPEIFGLDD